MTCTSLKNEEEGAVPPRDTLMMIRLICSLSKGIIDAFDQADLACM
jgi:hypothetical protein